MDCMGFRVVGNVHLIVVGEKNPTVADWNAYVHAVQIEERNGLNITAQMRTLVFSDGGGPNAAQRKLAADVLNGRSTPVAIVTNSAIMRGVMTALRWFNPQASAFAPSELSDAMAFLQIPEHKQDTLLKIARDLFVGLRIPPVRSLDAARLRGAPVSSSPR
jgi:hypothetical protein